MNITTIQKWGNSYAVRLPKATMKKLKLNEGHSVRFVENEKNGELRMIPVDARPKSLKEYVAGISAANKHHGADWGMRVGKEVW